jgi:hypothetical protein
MIRNDPSEAVRAEELLPMIGERFEIIDRRDLGGTIAQHLLYDIILNFAFEDPVARSLLEMILTFEAALIDQRRLGSDFAIVAARKKGAPPISECTVALPPLPPEAVGWRPSASHWLLRLLGIARLAGDPYRPTLNPPPPRGRATWEYVLAHAGENPHVRAMLEAMRRVY